MFRTRRAQPPLLPSGCSRPLLPLLPTFNDIASGPRAHGAVPSFPRSRHPADTDLVHETRSETRKIL